MDDTDTTFIGKPNVREPHASPVTTLDLVRAEIKRISQIVIQLSAKKADLSHAFDTVSDEMRKRMLELLKLEEQVKELLEMGDDRPTVTPTNTVEQCDKEWSYDSSEPFFRCGLPMGHKGSHVAVIEWDHVDVR